tara:strand:+ start:1099 stop:1209 length:111 start_codon:yes stop_codon:yes gene_type:complete
MLVQGLGLALAMARPLLAKLRKNAGYDAFYKNALPS